jgi:hypothetical protein
MSSYNTTKSAPSNRASAGPFDAAELGDLTNFVDFGAIKIQPVQDMEIRLEIEEATGRPVAISLDYQNSNLQLQPFAAPKSEGLWHEVRAQLTESIREKAGVVEERVGSFGLELVAKLPLVDDQGNSVGHRYARFIGVDGPRWFLRGMIGGAAINDPASASQIETLFRSVVVDRGTEPVPPRDLLALHLPAGVVTPPRPSLS